VQRLPAPAGPGVRGAYGTLVRYADDLLVVCRSRGQAKAALARLTALLANLGLQPKAAKTRIVHLTEGGEGSTSSASTIGWCGHGRVAGPAGSSTSPAGPPARRRSTPATASASRRCGPGWPRRSSRSCRRSTPSCAAGPGSPLRQLSPRVRQDQQVRRAAGRAVCRQAPPAGPVMGFAQVYRSPNSLGLISLNGTVVALRPNRPWRAPVEHRR
jgi:RNA-directed DNA polymerase